MKDVVMDTSRPSPDVATDMSRSFATLAIDVAIVAILALLAWTVHVALSDTNRPVDTIPPPAYQVEEPVYVVDP